MGWKMLQVTELLRLNQPVMAMDADTPDEEQAKSVS